MGLGGRVPPELVEFKPGDWLSADPFGEWTAARQAWVAAGNVWPGGNVARIRDEIIAATQVADEPWTPYGESA